MLAGLSLLIILGHSEVVVLLCYRVDVGYCYGVGLALEHVRLWLVALNHHVGVDHCVVVVFECHSAAFERCFALVRCLLNQFGWVLGGSLLSENHTLFHEVRCGHVRVSEVGFLAVLDFVDTALFIFHCFFVRLLKSVKIRVISAPVRSMPDLLAALTHFISIRLRLIHIPRVKLIRPLNMLVKLAPDRVLARLTATPPQLTRKVTLVRPARPVEILCFNIVLSAVFACFFLFRDFDPTQAF